MQAIWRGDKGYWRVVPIVNGEPQWSCSSPSTTCTTKPQGDANCDGSVNGADYSYWLNRQCTTGCVGTNLVADFNGDGRVDDSDYTIWFNNRQ